MAIVAHFVLVRCELAYIEMTLKKHYLILLF